jgi:DNA ligase-1
MIYDKLFKRDSTGRVRFWQMEIDGPRYRTLSGLHPDGAVVTSGWTTPRPASQPTGEAQAIFEVEAKYAHQLAREYHASLDTIDSPNFFEPMLAKPYAGYPGRCFAQPKLDGIRCIARAEGLFTRQGQPITAVPHIHAALAPLFALDPDAVLDGELYNHEFREDFGEISSIVRKKNPTVAALEKAEALMQYHVYDFPSSSGNFSNRWVELCHIVEDLDLLACIHLVQTVHVGSAELLDELYGQWIEDGFEGQMVRIDGPYEQKRSKLLLKRKEFMTREYRVKEFVEGNGNWAGAAKRATLINDDGSEFGAGIKGSYPKGVELLMGPKPTERSVATCRFFCLSPDGVPRFPVVVDYHPNGRSD